MHKTCILLSQLPVRWFPCCRRSLRIGHTITQKLVLLVQFAPIGQNFPGGQLNSANTSRDNDSIEAMHNVTHVNAEFSIC